MPVARAISPTVIDGLQWVYNNPQIPLVNMSWGFSTDSPPLGTAIQKLFSITAPLWWPLPETAAQMTQAKRSQAGEEGEMCDTPQTADIKYPAHYQWVIAVTAIDINYQITAYSLEGAKVDMAAPGGVLTGGLFSPPIICPLFMGLEAAPAKQPHMSLGPLP